MVLFALFMFVFPLIGLEMAVLYGMSAGINKPCVPPRKWALLFAWVFGVFGYSMIPIGETDITRYYEMVDEFGSESIRRIVTYGIEGLFTRDFLFYFTNRSGNHHILPFTVGFITYAIVFYVLFDMTARSPRRFTRGEIFMLGLTAAGVLSAYSVIGNIRCVSAYVLISFAVYRDMVQKKRDIWNIALYLIPIGLHVSAVAVLGLRFACFITKYTGKLVLCLTFLLPSLIRIAYRYAGLLGKSSIAVIIQRGISKAYYYLNWNEGGWADEVANSLSNKVVRIYGTFFLCMILLMILLSCKYSRGKGKTALGCLSIKTGVFWRLEAIVVLFSPVILIPLFEERSPLIHLLMKLLFASVCLILLVNTVWLFRNMDVGKTVVHYASASGIKIVCEICRGFMGMKWKP